MKQAGALRQVSDLSDFARGRYLRELLSQCHQVPALGPSHVEASPDRQHLLLLLQDPLTHQAQILAFQRPGPGGMDLERSWQPPPECPVVGLLFLQSPTAPPGAWALAIVWEQGRTEVWRFVPKVGWQLLQSVELCQGGRARIASICSQGGSLVWCEERPSLDAQLPPGRGAFRYCICTRSLEIGEQGAQLGSVRILLHNSPEYQVLASPWDVFLVPTPGTFPGAAKLLLIWCPQEAKITVTAPSRGSICSKALPPGGESDFKKLVAGCVGLLPSLEPLDVHSYTLTSGGGLLLLTQVGSVNSVQPDGAWRHVYDFAGSPLTPGEPARLKAFGSTLACLLEGILYLIDLHSGRLLEKKLLSTDIVYFLGWEEEEEGIQLLTPTGIYAIGFSGPGEDSSRSEPALVEMVFEEACKYYQRRSLSSTRLTVEKLKKGEMFQAPIVLSSILRHSLPQKGKAARGLPEPCAKLLDPMHPELQSYRSLELLKACVIGAPKMEVERCCEELVEQELNRLLRSDWDRETPAYVNAIFHAFPKASWKAVRGSLQLQQNSDGLLVARATPDVWKKVLGGTVPGGSRPEGTSRNGELPLFELICASLHTFKPKWLPQFVALTQQYVGVSWAYSSTEGPEGGVPLYKRALAALARRRDSAAAAPGPDREMEIELLLCSQRPKAVLQAVGLLIRQQRWQRVVQAAESFSLLSPLLNKEIFVALLAEFARHRELDPYLAALWELCPPDLTASDILGLVLQHLPGLETEPAPFTPEQGALLTVGLLKPLLQRVSQPPNPQAGLYADILQGPTFPPSTPPRQQRLEAAQPEPAPRTTPLPRDVV